MAFEHYIQKGSKKLRCGFTTGCCAALAAKAAALTLLSGQAPDTVAVLTPKGLTVEVSVLDVKTDVDYVSCAVMKDAGDDPDITGGALIYASVTRTDSPGIAIDGGIGVGRVTKPGLDQPVGAAAINRVPRQMIASEVQSVLDRFAFKNGLSVTVSIPAGAALAARTFNPKLGIEGGLSVLGTSGIVEPMSTQALIDSIGLELRQLAAEGYQKVMLTPGNYGEAFLKTTPYLHAAPTVKFSNFIGETLDYAAAYGYGRILVVGHIGKLVKVAGGIMNTHSSTADCRGEIIAAHAALSGAGRETVQALMNAVSTEACLDILDQYGLGDAVMSSLLAKIQEQLQRRVGGQTEIGAVVFSNARGFLGQTETARGIINAFTVETGKG
jgi:cobalt-precorrin-5B (C1)-methyltransferase